MAVPCHLFEHTNATYHPLGILDRRLVNRLWKMYGLDFPSSVFLTIGDADTLWHPQFSVPSLSNFAFDRRQATVVSGVVRIGEPREQYFGSHHAHSSYTMSFTWACHRLGHGRAATMIWTSSPLFRLTPLTAATVDVWAGILTLSPRTTVCFASAITLQWRTVLRLQLRATAVQPPNRKQSSVPSSSQ